MVDAEATRAQATDTHVSESAGPRVGGVQSENAPALHDAALLHAAGAFVGYVVHGQRHEARIWREELAGRHERHAVSDNPPTAHCSVGLQRAGPFATHGHALCEHLALRAPSAGWTITHDDA